MMLEKYLFSFKIASSFFFFNYCGFNGGKPQEIVFKSIILTLAVCNLKSSTHFTSKHVDFYANANTAMTAKLLTALEKQSIS